MKRLIFILLAVFADLVTFTQAQTPGEADPSFDSGSFVNDEVLFVVPAGDDNVYIAGRFTTVRGAVRNRIARLSGNGIVDKTFDPGSGANGAVGSMALQADGKMLIGGSFTSYNGMARNGLARLNANGSLDTGFDLGLGPNQLGVGISSLRSIAVQADGKVVIGGVFSSYDGVARNRIARLNGNGSLDAGFDPGSGANGAVNYMVLQADGKVLICGSFTSYNGVARNRIARLNADGSLDAGFDPGSGANGVVSSMALQADGKVLIGGYFTSYNGVVRNRIARLNTDGSLDAGFDPGSGANDGVIVALQKDGKVLIAGNFTTYNGVPRLRIARVNVDGTLDTSFAPEFPNTPIASVALQANGRVLIGGGFTTYAGVTRNRIARLNSDGSLDPSFAPGSGAEGDGWGTSMAFQADGKVLIGGHFTSYNGVVRNRVARLNADGSLDAGFDPGSGANGRVYSIALQTDGKVLIGGFFNSYNGVARSRIARLNVDGSFDTSFDPGTGVSEIGANTRSVNSVALQSDSKVLIGGDFASYDGVMRNNIARLNGDGSLDTGFDPGSGANDDVLSLVLQVDSKVLICGWFTIYNGVARNRIARLNSNGSLDAGFDPGSGANGAVSSMALQADGKVLIGGYFTSYNGVVRNRIARLNTDGSLDAGFDPGSGANGGVRSVAMQANGKVLIGGGFTSFNGVDCNGVARLNGDGSLDTSFDSGSGVNGLYDSRIGMSHPPNAYVASVGLQADGMVLFSGNFTSYGGAARSHLARAHNDPATESLSVVTNSEMFWSRGGTAPEVARVVFHLSTDQGASWTELGAGVRASGGWRLAGLTLPANRLLRARGFTGGGSVVEFTGSGYPVPTVTSVGSGTVPGLDVKQWIQISGGNFTIGTRVFLFDGTTEYLIPPERTSFVSGSQIRILANLTSEPAEWTVRVVSPGGDSSTPINFWVSPPMMVSPGSEVDFGTIAPYGQGLRTFTVRNGGNSPAALSATTTAPFEVIGGPFTNLAPGSEQQVVLRYGPTSPGSHAATVIFQLGGESATRTLTGRAAEPFAGGTGTVTGRVVQNVGGTKVPVGGSMVQLVRLVEGKREATGHNHRTGPTGEFSIERVTAGSYLLVAYPPSRAPHLREARRDVSVSEGAPSEHELELPSVVVPAPPNPYDIPVVLVRGRGKAGVPSEEVAYWAALRDRLDDLEFSHVWDPNILGTSYIDGQDGIQSNANWLHSYIMARSASLAEPPRRIHVVAHSMGGLIVRQMLHDDRTEQKLPPVGDVFMLSTPNAGTLLADYGAPGTDFFQDWQSNRDLRTEHIRRTFAPSVPWPGSAESGAGIRLFIAGGTRPSGFLYNGGSLIINLHSPRGGRENDGAVPLLSSRGYWLASRSLFLTDLTMFSAFEVPEFALAPQSVALNHTQIKQDAVMLDWIVGILRGGLPRPIATPAGEAPPEAPAVMSESLDASQELASSVSVDFRSITVAPGMAINHNLPLETVPQADFVISFSDPTISVRLIEPGGAVIDAASAAGNSAINFQTLNSEDGGMVTVSISDPVPGLWQVVVDGGNTAAEATALIQVSSVSDLRLIPGHPERVGATASVPLTAKVVAGEGDDVALVPGGTVAVSMVAPEGQDSPLSLLDDGSQGDDAANDGTHGLIVSDQGGPGDYELSYIAEGVHPSTGEAFRRFARGSFTRATPGGFVTGILSHTAVDSDDNGYPDTVMVETRVDVAAAGDYVLSGRLLSGEHEEAITAVADFSTNAAGSFAVTILFTPHELPEGLDIGPFDLDELLLFRRGEETELLDVFAGSYEVPVTFRNEVSRIIRLSGDLAFGEVRVGQTAQRTLMIHNDGWATLGIGEIVLPAGFSAAYSGRIDPGDSVEVEVVFAPTQGKAYQGEASVESDALAGTSALSLGGDGIIIFADWIATAGAPPGQDGPNDDPTGREVPNLLAYWLNLPPGSSGAADYNAAMPKLQRVGDALTYTYRRNRNAYGVRAVLEASPSLAADSWEEVVPAPPEEIGTDPVTGDPIIRLTVPAGNSPRRFLRLRVEFEEE